MTLRVLGFRASIAGPAEALDTIAEIYSSVPDWAIGTPVEPSLQVRISATVLPGAWQVFEGQDLFHDAQDRRELAAALEWLITSRAVECLSRDYLLFHAGAVAYGGSGCILPARSGSGKSTLTAALAAEGFSYFSDEVAIWSPRSRYLLPFAKNITIKAGSFQLLAGRFVELSGPSAACGDSPARVAYLQPPPSAWPLDPVHVRYIVFPRHVAGASSHLEPLPRSEGLARLLDHSFSAQRQGAAGIQSTVELVGSAECYALTVGDLASAVRLVRQLMSD